MIVAVLDTSILLRKGLMEFILRVASADACAPRISQSLFDETSRKLAEGARDPELVPTLAEALRHVANYGMAVVQSEHHSEAQDLVNDPGDVHVLASAFATRDEDPAPSTTLLVTENLKDFDIDAVADHGVVVVSADAFGCHLLEQRPIQVLTQIQRQPPERYEKFLERMRRDGLVGTASAIQSIVEDLDV